MGTSSHLLAVRLPGSCRSHRVCRAKLSATGTSRQSGYSDRTEGSGSAIVRRANSIVFLCQQHSTSPSSSNPASIASLTSAGTAISTSVAGAVRFVTAAGGYCSRGDAAYNRIRGFQSRRGRDCPCQAKKSTHAAHQCWRDPGCGCCCGSSCRLVRCEPQQTTGQPLSEWRNHFCERA